MIFNTEATYYDILEIRPDASATDVRTSYQRLKQSYKKDNIALYSVMDASDTQDMIAKIDEAYQVLSDPDLRREYDERHGILSSVSDKIVSIDRTPPMENGDDLDLLVPPSTDFGESSIFGSNSGDRTGNFERTGKISRPESSFFDLNPPSKQNVPGLRPEEKALPKAAEESMSAALGSTSAQVLQPTSAGVTSERRQIPTRRSVDAHAFQQAKSAFDAIQEQIDQEVEWRGSFLRKVRELRRYSMDDIHDQTKISKMYLVAIEEENFNKLPAAVFVRGFILQISKVLRLPGDRVATAYLSRFNKRQSTA